MKINDVLTESPQLCPECGGPAFSDLILAEKKDACYHKVKATAKVWPSAYASGRLVQCRKKGAANWGNKSKNESVAEEISADQKRKTYDYIYQIMVKNQPEFMYRANNADVKKAILQVMNYGDQISPHDMASYAYGLLKSGAIREQGVAEAINPDITNPAFSHQQQIGDYLYVARYWSKGLKISAYHGDKQIGYAELMYQTAPFDDFADPKTTPKRVWLESEWTKVNPKYQRQGIMSTMYAYAKMLGNSVKPSELRSPEAKAAWASWRQAGDAKHLTSNEGVAEGLNEFAPAGGGTPPRGPRTPGGDPWGGDDSGEDSYGTPKPRHYARSSSYFEQFEADHFDDEVFDAKTGVFKGYWDDEEGRVQIAYFKFDDPTRTGGDDPGMGWYYEPQMEGMLDKFRKAKPQTQAPELLFYAKNSDGSKTYINIKDAEQLSQAEQRFRGQEVKKLDLRRKDVLDWLESRGVSLSKFWPGAEITVGDRRRFGESQADDNPVTNAIYRRLMNQKPDLFTRYGLEVVAQAVEDVADSVGHLEPDDEIGSSDVSGWVRRVEQNLSGAGMAEGSLSEVDRRGFLRALGGAALGAAGVGAASQAQARVTQGADGQMSPSFAQQMAQQVQASPGKSGGQMPNQNIDTAEKVERRDNGIIVHYGGKEYKGVLVPKDGPTPRGAKMIKITQAQMGERGIGNYTTYLLPNGTAHIYILPSRMEETHRPGHRASSPKNTNDLIGGRYDPDEFDQMVLRLKQMAQKQERERGPVDLKDLARRLRGADNA